MSESTVVKLVNPYGDTDDVLKLTIDSDSAYYMRNVVKVPGEYTFSIWAKSNSSTYVFIDLFGESESFQITSQWERLSVTATITNVDLNNYSSLSTEIDGTAYFYEATLVKGPNDTEWTPAPEDTSSKIASLTETVDEDGKTLASVVKDISEPTEDDPDSGRCMMWSRYLHYSSDPNKPTLTLGTSDSPLKLSFDNREGEGIKFERYGLIRGQWDESNFYAGNLVIRTEERAQFGNFAFVPRSDNSLMFKKVK